MDNSVIFGLIAVYIALIVFIIIVYWRIYEKAGQPGWASIVPFYNTYVLIVRILEMPSFWFWLLFVPFLNIAIALILIFMIPFKLAEKFGKGAGFGVGLLLLGIIFLPILAFGSAEYQGGRGRRDDYYNADDEDDRPGRGRRRDDQW